MNRQELKTKHLETMSAAERAEHDRSYAAAKLAAEVGDRARQAREAAGIGQRELARRMGTGQSAVDRLEAGGARACAWPGPGPGPAMRSSSNGQGYARRRRSGSCPRHTALGWSRSQIGGSAATRPASVAPGGLPLS
ncbi:MAG: helix-turn-helix domain-containing protein [Acidimicrobiales bacterium]